VPTYSFWIEDHRIYIYGTKFISIRVRDRVMVFNHGPNASHWTFLSYNVVSCRVVPNDSHEHLLSQQYFKNTIPVIHLLPSSDKLIEV
jgi:hypothetical protein